MPDSKSGGGNIVLVRVRPGAPNGSPRTFGDVSVVSAPRRSADGSRHFADVNFGAAGWRHKLDIGGASGSESRPRLQLEHFGLDGDLVHLAGTRNLIDARRGPIDARDRAGIFGHECIFCATDGDWPLSRLGRQSLGGKRLFRRRRETGFAPDCVVGLVGLKLATNRLWAPT
jgi:hypothetical protein